MLWCSTRSPRPSLANGQKRKSDVRGVALRRHDRAPGLHDSHAHAFHAYQPRWQPLSHDAAPPAKATPLRWACDASSHTVASVITGFSTAMIVIAGSWSIDGSRRHPCFSRAKRGKYIRGVARNMESDPNDSHVFIRRRVSVSCQSHIITGGSPVVIASTPT